MVTAEWKSTFSATRNGWRSSWTVASTSATPRPTAATAEKTCYCKRMAILCSDSSPRMSERDSTTFWMRFSERSRIGDRNDEPLGRASGERILAAHAIPVALGTQAAGPAQAGLSPDYWGQALPAVAA